MSLDVKPGTVVFDAVSKEYRLGYRRAFFAAALPGGRGLGGGGQLKALDDVSFRVEPGESFALLGHNGAGKSTALKCLSGVTRPTSGRVQVGGRVSALIELGVGFHPDLSGLENLKFAAALAGVRGAAARQAVDQAINFAEIDDFLDTPVKRYSSGMVARIGFGIATALPGDILVVDEVLAVGDAAFQRKCQRLLLTMREEQGRTLLFVSHNEWVVKETCQRAALLAHGRLVCVAPVQDALRAYAALQEEIRHDSGDVTGQAATRITALSVTPVDRRIFDGDEPITLDCSLEISDEVKTAVVAVCLLNSSGQIVWAVYSDELGLALPPGASRVEVMIDRLAALPGACRLQVFAFDRGLPLVQEIRTLEITIAGPRAHGLEHGLVSVSAAMTIALG